MQNKLMHPVNFRKIEERDDEHIASEMVRYYNKAKKNKTWMSEYDELDLPDFMYTLLSEEDFNCYIVEDQYLVVYSFNNFWFNKKPYLYVNLVLKVYNNNKSFDDVIAFLHNVAIENNISNILAATGMSITDKALIKKYQQYGFTHEEVLLQKILKE